MNRILIALAMGTMLTSAAHAGDLGRERGASTKDAPLPPPLLSGTAVSDNVNWRGLYIGGHVGYGWGEMDATRRVEHHKLALSKCETKISNPQHESDPTQPEFIDGEPALGLSKEACEATAGADGNPGHYCPPNHVEDRDAFTAGSFDWLSEADRGRAKIDMDGWFGGADLSYKFQTGRLILEPFVDLSYGGGKGSIGFERKDVALSDADGNVPGFADGLTEQGGFSFQKRWGGTLGLKAGGLLTERDYLYGLAGVAYGSFKVKGGSSFTDGNLASDFPASSFNETVSGWGWTAGAGWERALTNHWHLGVEGRYTQIDGLDASFSGASEPNSRGHVFTTDEKLSGDYSEWSVLGRISYRLGGE